MIAATVITTADALRAVHTLVLRTLEDEIRTGTTDPKLPEFLAMAANFCGGRDTLEQITRAARNTRAQVSVRVLESTDDTIAELHSHFAGMLTGQARAVFHDLFDEGIEPGWLY